MACSALTLSDAPASSRTSSMRVLLTKTPSSLLATPALSVGRHAPARQVLGCSNAHRVEARRETGPSLVGGDGARRREQRV